MIDKNQKNIENVGNFRTYGYGPQSNRHFRVVTEQNYKQELQTYTTEQLISLIDEICDHYRKKRWPQFKTEHLTAIKKFVEQTNIDGSTVLKFSGNEFGEAVMTYHKDVEDIFLREFAENIHASVINSIKIPYTIFYQMGAITPLRFVIDNILTVPLKVIARTAFRKGMDAHWRKSLRLKTFDELTWDKQCAILAVFGLLTIVITLRVFIYRKNCWSIWSKREMERILSNNRRIFYAS